MVDYYSILLRAVTAPGAGERQWRRGVYDRARQMLASRLRARSRRVPRADDRRRARRHGCRDRSRSNLEMAWTERPAIDAAGDDMTEAAWSEPRPRADCKAAAIERHAAGSCRRSSSPRSAPAATCSGPEHTDQPGDDQERSREPPPRRSRPAGDRRRPRTANSPPASMAARRIPTSPMCFGASRPSIARCNRSAPSSSTSCSTFSI